MQGTNNKLSQTLVILKHQWCLYIVF